ncbi:MAG: hypothetical protein JWQ21_2486 [Herminiimonas sp.]|nr:hypothetical protein [Herminiimonas sp.]
MNAFVIDGFEFCRLKERREGEIAVSDFARLVEELGNKSGTLQWSLQGGADKLDHPQLTLSVSGVVQLRCQRCLAPFAFTIASESILILAKDEASADEIDDLLADDTIDVIVGSRSLDVIGLIEDEALLALPISPKHATCLDQATADALNNTKADSPFSVLKNLKK